MTAISHPDDGRTGQAAQVVDVAEPEAAAPATPRDWLRSPVLQGGAALLIYVLAWIPTAFRPIVHHPALALLNQKSVDPNFYVWSLRW